MTDQTINLSGGAVEYTLAAILTETTGKDITGDTVKISVGTYTAPGTWLTPDIVEHPTVSSVSAQLLVGTTVTPASGQYYVWLKLGDNPETVPRRFHRLTIISTVPPTPAPDVAPYVREIQPGTGVTVDDEDPARPRVSASGIDWDAFRAAGNGYGYGFEYDAGTPVATGSNTTFDTGYVDPNGDSVDISDGTTVENDFVSLIGQVTLHRKVAGLWRVAISVNFSAAPTKPFRMRFFNTQQTFAPGQASVNFNGTLVDAADGTNQGGHLLITLDAADSAIRMTYASFTVFPLITEATP